MKRLRVSGPAERDLDDIWLYAATSQSYEIQDRLIESITSAFALIAASPGIGTKRDYIHPGTRGFPVGQYVFYYRENARSTVIARVLHGMRDQKSAYGKTIP